MTKLATSVTGCRPADSLLQQFYAVFGWHEEWSLNPFLYFWCWDWVMVRHHEVKVCLVDVRKLEDTILFVEHRLQASSKPRLTDKQLSIFRMPSIYRFSSIILMTSNFLHLRSFHLKYFCHIMNRHSLCSCYRSVRNEAFLETTEWG